jgi:SAM-dependent methyltransferase
MRTLSRLRNGLASLQWSEFALARSRCPFCGPSLFVRLHRGDAGVRCVRCTAAEIHLALGRALQELVPDVSSLDACEFSARGPLVEHLRRRARSVAVSEYFADVEPGRSRDGVRCEDMQRLTYADSSFDLITHTEVLEHVPDDARALAELHRVLRRGGRMLFSVPLHGEATIERARLVDGAVVHLLPPAYHADPQRPDTGVLAFRDYGADLLDRLRGADFADVRLHTVQSPLAWLPARRIVFARRI